MATLDELRTQFHQLKMEYDFAHEAYKREKSCADMCPYALAVYYNDGMELAHEIESLQERIDKMQASGARP